MMCARAMATVAALAALAVTVPATADTLALRGATVYVNPTTKLEGATVVVRDGRIAALGPEVAVPDGARVIDASGKIITAGLVDAVSTVGLIEVELEASSVEAGFDRSAPGDDHVHAAYRVSDGYRAASVTIPVARTGGLTSVIAVPRGGLVAGQSAWVSLAATVDPRAATLRDPTAMHAAFGIASMSSAGGSRGLAIERIRELLDDARSYGRDRRAFEQGRTRDFAAARLDLEALQPVVRGELPLAIRANVVSDILAAARVAREDRVRVIIIGGAEAWMAADTLAAASIPVILDPTRNLPTSFDTLHVRNDSARILAAAGVRVTISTLGSAHEARTLRQRAGIAVAYGLPWADALAAITSVPAAIFGFDQVGTLERGKRADLVVWSGDPLELATRAEIVIIGGVEQSLVTHQSRLLDRYRRLAPR
jgi:imidazolonepropionase-like amidohydrolase